MSKVSSSRTSTLLVKSRLMMGILESMGTPISRSLSPASFSPPSRSVPLSGTETVHLMRLTSICGT